MSDTLFQPLQNALSTFLSYLPQLIGAIVILIIGYIVAISRLSALPPSSLPP